MRFQPEADVVFKVFWKVRIISKQNLRINERIRTNPIRLIDENNNQVGVIDVKEAQFKAHNLGLDLVEVSPNAEPPVCRIMDYGKHLYEQKRKVKLSQKKQHTVVLKEIRIRPKIDDHDRDIKINRAIKFLEKGNKVQFTMLFRGREMMHVDRGREIMNEVTEVLAELGKIERPPQMLGRRMTMVIVPEAQHWYLWRRAAGYCRLKAFGLKIITPKPEAPAALRRIRPVGIQTTLDILCLYLNNLGRPGKKE